MNETRRIYARKVTVSIISTEDARDFLNKNHRSGATNENSKSLVSIGLFYVNELVAVSQFCSPRTAKKLREYSTELLRMAFKYNVRVTGGASKMIAFYINNFHPSDIFTYQDTTGEATDVYEKCGFTLIEENKKKSYFVAPGKTVDTGSKKEVLSASYATRFGPDRILNTKIGEIFDSNGKRKSNKRIFLEDLNWHIEETSGDRVYEWINPNLTFYVYKTTALTSDKFYYGVSHVKKSNATIEDCLKDGYFGSGGGNINNKFRNWKKKHSDSLQKEIIGVFKRKALAYLLEIELIGDKYKTDRNCLNSTSGGKYGGINFSPQKYSIKTCEIHKSSTFQGDTCMKCAIGKSLHTATCSIHGETKHRGGVCNKCSISKIFTEKECAEHGISIHKGKYCVLCQASESLSNQICAEHGLTTHRWNLCQKCLSFKKYSLKNCEIHGIGSHNGSRCVTCLNQAIVSLRDCPVHGKVKHQGSTCGKCSGSALHSLKKCEKHGLVDHMGDYCSTCNSQKSVTIKSCSTHGETKHQGNTCCKCAAAKKYSIKACTVHGEVKHAGLNCMKCSSAKRKDYRNLKKI